MTPLPMALTKCKLQIDSCVHGFSFVLDVTRQILAFSHKIFKKDRKRQNSSIGPNLHGSVSNAS